LKISCFYGLYKICFQLISVGIEKQIALTYTKIFFALIGEG
jgi:hypothetical protein